MKKLGQLLTAMVTPFNEEGLVAYEQAKKWDHKYIGAEHLLTGILLAGKGEGFKILSNLGITLEKVREETTKLIVCSSEPNQ